MMENKSSTRDSCLDFQKALDLELTPGDMLKAKTKEK
jgi:hypothetical protein